MYRAFGLTLTLLLMIGKALAIEVDSYAENFDLLTYGTPTSISTQSDGKAVLVTKKTANHYNVIRLNYDGSIDSSFNSVTLTSSNTLTIGKPYILPNDKIVLIGNFNSFRGDPAYGIARLNLNGGTDFLYDSNQYSSLSSAQIVTSVVQDYNGDLLVGRPYGIERWKPSDLRDTNFSLRLYKNGSAARPANIIPRIDGRLVVTHSGMWIYGDTGKIDVEGISEFLPDGRGLQTLSIQNDLTSQESGIYASSPFITGSVLITRITSNNIQHPIGKLESDNSLSNSFNIDLLPGDYPSNRNSSIIQLSNGSLIISVAGHPFSGGYTLKRFTHDGSLDQGFDMQAGVTSNVYSSSHNQFGIQSVATQLGGNILVVGGFDTIMGITRPGIARITEASECSAP